MLGENLMEGGVVLESPYYCMRSNYLYVGSGWVGEAGVLELDGAVKLVRNQPFVGGGVNGGLLGGRGEGGRGGGGGGTH